MSDDNIRHGDPMTHNERRRALEFAKQQHEFCDLLADTIRRGDQHPEFAGRCARLLASIKRGHSKATPVVIAKMLRMLPLHCYCGAPGIYRVGMKGFCSRHREDAASLNRSFVKLKEQRASWLDHEWAEQDKKLRVRHRAGQLRHARRLFRA
jgi:hypothetical protein